MRNSVTWFLNFVMQIEAIQQAGADPYERTNTRNAHRKIPESVMCVQFFIIRQMNPLLTRIPYTCNEKFCGPLINRPANSSPFDHVEISPVNSLAAVSLEIPNKSIHGVREMLLCFFK